MLNVKLIKIASGLINYKEFGNSSMGSVACALVSEGGNIYTGVCIDTLQDLLPLQDWRKKQE